MGPWGRATEAEYRKLPLLAQELLADVPVHDVWRVFLPSSDRPCSMDEVRRTARGLVRDGSIGRIVPALFGLRRWMGTLMRWDRATAGQGRKGSRTQRVPPAVLAESLVQPGSMDGPFQVVYVLNDEALSEVKNLTVEAYLVCALRSVQGGCELLWAIHVLPVGRWTRPYLALIAPFRRLIVYPVLLRAMHAAWRA